METQGAFPGWLNRLWWLLLPGTLLAVVWALGMNIFSNRTEGISAVAGGFGSFTARVLMGVIVVFLLWIIVSVILMHLWLSVAMGFAWLQRRQLRRNEEWKVAGALVALLAIYSRPIGAFIVRLLSTG